MQHVLIEKPYEFTPAIENSFVKNIFLKLGLFKPTLRKREGVVDYELRNVERLQDSISAGHAILLTPNHPRTADPISLCYLAAAAPCNFYLMASSHLFYQGWFKRYMVRMMGAFSVNREGMDKKAVEYAIDILQNAKRPLVIFPEGTTSRTNDQLMSLMDGPSFIARTAAKRRAKKHGGKVVVHPVCIKYLFGGDIDSACNDVLEDLENRLTWRPQADLPLVDRIVKVGDAMLRLKELQYGVMPNPDATLKERQNAMVNRLLHPLEKEWLGAEQADGIAIRIKNLRMKIFPDMKAAKLDTAERNRRWRHLEDTYLAQQIDCYPEQYVTVHPSVDRLLETVEKFEEDLTTKARVHGNLKVIISVDEPIEVATKRDRAATEDPLMAKIRDRLQKMLDEMKHESKMYGN